ncbi:HWE histidine kinase domain-containing protein [Jannaschia sp. 2305UL9-9]|uniref:PAS domain-containing sensor histidine kinase n=1 Tax=Jannaschia sp. 2305UL9-9 TaxID=3121638 RepID=UPI0035270949
MRDLSEGRDSLTEKKLTLGLEVAGVGLGEVDYDANTITLDERAAGMFDLPPNTPISRDVLHERIHPEDRMSVLCKVTDMLDPNGSHFMDVVHRVTCGDGTVRWLNARKQCMFATDTDTGETRAVSGLVAVLDVTDRKAAEDKVRFVMEEVSHRSKNLMAVMQTIARMTAATPAEKAFAQRFGDRMGALSFNQDLLVRNSWTHVQLSDLVGFHLEPFVAAKVAKVHIDGPDTELSPDAAQAIGMALHELATNAGKYGAFQAEGGNVSIEWAVSTGADPVFTISWTETGGPPVQKPETSGFGQKVLTRMAAQSVDGKVDLRYDPGGVSWSLTAPASRILRQVFG